DQAALLPPGQRAALVRLGYQGAVARPVGPARPRRAGARSLPQPALRAGRADNLREDREAAPRAFCTFCKRRAFDKALLVGGRSRRDAAAGAERRRAAARAVGLLT